jgi:uncharacterized membrane protein
MSSESMRCGVREGVIGGLFITALMAAASLYVQSKLPPGARVPIHWNAAGKIDGYAGAGVGLWLMPGIAVGTLLLVIGVTYLEPRREHMQQSMRAYMIICMSVLLLLLATHLAALWAALGHPFNMTKVMGMGVGLMLVVIGNYLGKLRSNFFAGVRSPWTLSSELSWNKTHRLAGKLFVALGLASALVSLQSSMVPMIVLYTIAVPFMLVFLMVYSYQVWKTDPDRTGTRL